MIEKYKKEKAVNNIINIPLIQDKKKDMPKQLDEKLLQKMWRISKNQMIDDIFLKVYSENMDKDMYDKCSNDCKEIYEKHIKFKEIISIVYDYFQKHNISFWIIKGLGLAYYTNSDEYIRDYNDVDIIVEEKNMQKAMELLCEIGFECETSIDVVEYMDSMECYEVSFFYPFFEGGELSKKLNNKISVELKVGTSSIKSTSFMKELCENAVTVRVDDMQINIMNVSDSFLVLCTNFYCNIELEFAKLKIRDLFDLYYFYKNNVNNIDFNYVLSKSINHKVTHQVYATMVIFNSIYDGIISANVLDSFEKGKNLYDSTIYNGYDDGFRRDWNIDVIDIMLDRNTRMCELYYEHSLKLYTSRNNKFREKIYISSLTDNGNEIEKNELLNGIKSKKNEIEVTYKVDHSSDKVYFSFYVKKMTFSDNTKIVLMLFDVDRNEPQKMIGIYLKNDCLIAENMQGSMKLDIVKSSRNQITITVNKDSFNVLQNYGRVLAYRIFGMRRFNNTYFAITDDWKIFDHENCNLLYLCDTLKEYLW